MIWLLVSFGFAFYARELVGLAVFGWPLPFYMAAQGTTLVYLALIGVYAQAMNKLDALAATEAAREN
jgi:putative solute:sodium symporter small subunit